jgi:hypothetical protein
MIRKCCLDTSCKKISPVAYSGRPFHTIGEVPTGVPSVNDDVFGGVGELYSVEYSNQLDNVFSYKVTGDNKNVYHCCGTDGIHVYPLSDFYENGNLSSRWKIYSSSSQGISSTSQSFFYGEEGFGYKITGYLNSSDGVDSSYRYGYEPTRFSGFYDCKVVGQYLIAARGVDGVNVFKLNPEKTSAVLVRTVKPSGCICKHIEVGAIGSFLFILIGSARYEKPNPAFTSDAFDLPSTPDKDFDDPTDLASLVGLGWGQDTAKYTYASMNGYESATTDGFDSISTEGMVGLYCIMFNPAEDRWILEDGTQSDSENWESLLKENLYHGPDADGQSGEVTSISYSWGDSTGGDKESTRNILVNYGFAIQGGPSPTGGSKGSNLSITKTRMKNNEGENIDRFSMDGSAAWQREGTEPVLDFLDQGGASFSSRYFDGAQGGQSLNNGGVAIEKDGVGNILYELVDLKYDYLTLSSSTYIYDLFSAFKIDVHSIIVTRSKMVLSIYEGGLLVCCRDTTEGSSILDWENFDSLSTNLSGSPRAMISSLSEEAPSTLNIIDSWSDGKTIFSVDCLQSSTIGGPRSLGLYSFESSIQEDGSPEVLDSRRSYLYRSDAANKSACGGGLVAFSLTE